METDVLPIAYSGYYDAPLSFLVEHAGTVYLFRRGDFDDDIDDYPSEYEVFPTDLTAIESPESWNALWERFAQKSFGKIHFREVVLDPNYPPKYIKAATFEKISLP